MEPATKTNKKHVQPKYISIFKHVLVALSEHFFKKIYIYTEGFIHVCHVFKNTFLPLNCVF